MIMSNEIKAVIFDFNGVFNENVEYRIVREGSRRLGCLFVLSCISYFYWHFAHQTGKLNSFDFWKKVFFSRKKGFEEKEYQEIVVKEIENAAVRKEMFELLKKLKKKGMEVRLLSNSADVLTEVFAKKGFFREFDKVFLSEEIKVMKPFPEAFRKVLKGTGLKASECLFVDDQIQNTLIAKMMGFRIIKFKNYKKLVKDLKVFGL